MNTLIILSVFALISIALIVVSFLIESDELLLISIVCLCITGLSGILYSYSEPKSEYVVYGLDELDDDYNHTVGDLQSSLLSISIDMTSDVNPVEQLVSGFNKSRTDFYKLRYTEDCGPNMYELNYTKPIDWSGDSYPTLKTYFIPIYVFVTFTEEGDYIKVDCSSPTEADTTQATEKLYEEAGLDISSFSFTIPLTSTPT